MVFVIYWHGYCARYWQLKSKEGGVPERVCMCVYINCDMWMTLGGMPTQHDPTESQCTIFLKYFPILYLTVLCNLEHMTIINRSASLLWWPVTRKFRQVHAHVFLFFFPSAIIANVVLLQLKGTPPHPPPLPLVTLYLMLFKCMQFFHSECTETTCKDDKRER